VPGATCNLYREHLSGETWEDPKLLAVLSEEDSPDWGTRAGTLMWKLTARVSSDGRYLAFMSNRPLTGYDNRDLNPQAHEARDEEVFLYDSAGESLACPSCNPNPAQRPTGVFDTESAGEGENLRVDPAGRAWKDRWLAGSIPGWTQLSFVEAPYQSRYLLDNGRLFFNSADALVPEDVNHREETIEGKATQVGVEDVYQYEPAGVGSCAGPSACVSLLSSGTSPQESAFLDASANGNDVFLFTSQKLVPTDPDSTFDAYDARVCTEASPCVTPPPPPPPPCSGESTCRGGSAPPPGFGSGGSSTFVGPGNVGKIETLPSRETKGKTLTRAQKLAKALSSCRKKYKHSKKKRATCERQARQKYGAKKAAAKHKGGKAK
jgi:hypothetical protein